MLNQKDIKDLQRIVKKIDYNEDDISFYLFYPYLFNHHPNIDINELEISEVVNDFKDALFDVLEYVKETERFKNRILKII